MPTRLPVLEVDAAHIDEACVVRVQGVDRLTSAVERARFVG